MLILLMTGALAGSQTSCCLTRYMWLSKPVSPTPAEIVGAETDEAEDLTVSVAYSDGDVRDFSFDASALQAGTGDGYQRIEDVVHAPPYEMRLVSSSLIIHRGES